MSNLIKYQFVDLHPSDTVKINNNDKKDNFIPLGKDGGISIETIGQQEAEKAKKYNTKMLVIALVSAGIALASLVATILIAVL